MNKNIYEILLDTVSEAKKCDNLAQTMALIHLTVIDLLENKIIVDDPNRSEQRGKAVLEHCVVTYGKEISRFSAIDREGVEFRCSNVVYKEKIFFVVSANKKIIECMPIEMEMYYNKGIKNMQKRQIEQLEYIRNKIEDMMSIDSMLFMPLADLYNEIGLMQNDTYVGKDED